MNFLAKIDTCKTTFLRLVVCVMMVLIMPVFGMVKDTYAATDTYNSIMEKAVAQGIYKCYSPDKDFGPGSAFKESMDWEDYSGLKSMMTENRTKTVALVAGAGSTSMFSGLFSGLTYDNPGGIMSCFQLFGGNDGTTDSTQLGGGAKGILELSGHPAPKKNSSELKGFYATMGYDVSTPKSTSEKECYKVNYKMSSDSAKASGKTRSTNSVCKNKEGKLSVEGNVSASNGASSLLFTIISGKVCPYWDTNASPTAKASGCKKISLTKTKLKEVASGYCKAPSCTVEDVKKVDSMKGATAKWKDGDWKKAAFIAIRNLTGNKEYTKVADIKMDDMETRVLYQSYLQNYYGITPNCPAQSDDEYTVSWVDYSTKTVKKNCGVSTKGANKNSGENNTVNGITKNGYFSKTWLYLPKTKEKVKANRTNLIKALGELKTTYTEEEWKELDDILSSGTDHATGPNGEEAGEDSCAGAGGAGALGWIVCPILEWMGNAAENVYNQYVEPSLQVSPKLFQNTKNGGYDSSPTNTAWSTFRDMANIAFVIILLIVIFSQLTGVGIDNYGIKKILPKLVAMAILVNLSYLICLLAVDISNILGNGFQALFNKGLSDRLTIPDSVVIPGANGNSNPVETGAGTATALTGVVLLGGIVAGGAAIWANPAIILSLLVSALGIVVAVFFLFILLTVREAAIIVLVVISPLAMVAYALPNTKKMFDRWLNLFKNMLMVYPICGLLVGAGGYISKLLIMTSTNGTSGVMEFIAAFTAMIVSIVPIFLIPMVIKNAMSAMGSIGAKLAGMGQRASGGATGFVRNRTAYKNLQAMGQERKAGFRAGLNADGGEKRGIGGALSMLASGGRRGRQRSRMEYRGIIDKRGSLEAADQPGFMEEVNTNNEVKRIRASAEINNPEELRAGLERALNSGDKVKIRAYTDVLSGMSEGGRDKVREAYDNTATTRTKEAEQAFRENIMNNHQKDYKDNARSLIGALENNKNGAGANGYETTSDYAATAAGRKKLMMKSKSGTMAGMDDASFAEAFIGNNGAVDSMGKSIGYGHEKAKIDLGGLSDDEKRAVGQNAHNALQNATNMDATRANYLQQIVTQSGYRPPVQEVSIAGGGSTGGGGGMPPASTGGGSTMASDALSNGSSPLWGTTNSPTPTDASSSGTGSSGPKVVYGYNSTDKAEPKIDTQTKSSTQPVGDSSVIKIQHDNSAGSTSSSSGSFSNSSNTNSVNVRTADTNAGTNAARAASPIITGRNAERAFNEGRRSGEFKLPH